MGKRPDTSRRPASPARIIPLKGKRKRISAPSEVLPDNYKSKSPGAYTQEVFGIKPSDNSGKQKPKAAVEIEMPESRKSIREEKRKAKLKAKAEKAYAKTYGSDGALKGVRKSVNKAADMPSEGSPRPALYKGKMGASQKKSSKMQTKASNKAAVKTAKAMRSVKAKKNNKVVEGVFGTAKTFSASAQSRVSTTKNSRIFKQFGRLFFAVGVLCMIALFLYGPAQDYYQQMRETDRLQAEYIAVATQGHELKSEIEALKTDEGIEDRAHHELGYIKNDEETASVKGFEVKRRDDFSTAIVPGSIPAPQTWYSPVLDVLFGYSG